MGDCIELCLYEDASFQNEACQRIKIPVGFVTSLLTGRCVGSRCDYPEMHLDKVPQYVTITQQVSIKLYKLLTGSNGFLRMDQSATGE